jgi:hypothetical protein
MAQERKDAKDPAKAQEHWRVRLAKLISFSPSHGSFRSFGFKRLEGALLLLNFAGLRSGVRLDQFKPCAEFRKRQPIVSHSRCDSEKVRSIRMADSK